MYGNIKVLSQAGDLLFRASDKKIQWYLSKGLATKVDEETIQLTFEHAGTATTGDTFTLSEKVNQCVVCGTIDNLTKHHVVPYWYRKHFPLKYKCHSSHDVLLVCRECHSWYERRFADPFKLQLASEYDIPLYSKEALAKLRQQMLAKAILNHKEKMPKVRQEDLIIRLAIELGDFPNDEEIVKLSSDDFEKESRYCHGKSVVEKVVDLQSFVERWRQHFVDSMRPRYLPKGWSIERSLELDAQGKVS